MKGIGKLNPPLSNINQALRFFEEQISPLSSSEHKMTRFSMAQMGWIMYLQSHDMHPAFMCAMSIVGVDRHVCSQSAALVALKAFNSHQIASSSLQQNSLILDKSERRKVKRFIEINRLDERQKELTLASQLILYEWLPEDSSPILRLKLINVFFGIISIIQISTKEAYLDQLYSPSTKVNMINKDEIIRCMFGMIHQLLVDPEIADVAWNTIVQYPNHTIEGIGNVLGWLMMSIHPKYQSKENIAQHFSEVRKLSNQHPQLNSHLKNHSGKNAIPLDPKLVSFLNQQYRLMENVFDDDNDDENMTYLSMMIDMGVF